MKKKIKILKPKPLVTSYDNEKIYLPFSQKQKEFNALFPSSRSVYEYNVDKYDLLQALYLAF